MARGRRALMMGKPATTSIPSPAGSVRMETFIPWTLVKRDARREVITPLDAPTAFQDEIRTENEQREREQHSPLLRALALAHYWQRLLDEGKFRSLTEIAAAEGMDVGQVSRIARLMQLVPDLVEACMAGEANTLALEDLIRRALPVEWGVQRWKLLIPRADP